MANRVTFIVGLPGSGKSFHALRLDIPHAVLIDDPTKDSSNHMIDMFESGVDLVITDPWLCNAKNREYATKIANHWNYEITWIFFENDVEKCKKNLKYRNDDRVIERFEVFNYTIPEGYTPLTIWQPN